MHQDSKIEHGEEEYVFRHIRVAHLRFGDFELPHWHQVAKLAFLVDVAPVLVVVDLFLYTSSMSAVILQHNFWKDVSCSFDIHEPSLGVILLQPSPVHA